MKAPTVGGGLVIGFVAALGLLLFPLVAQAKVAVGAEGSDAPPGITITGIGFARLGPIAHAGGEARERATDVAHATAVDRAVGDARRRSKAIARALGLQVGPPTDVDLREIGQFGQSRSCRQRNDGDRRRCRRPRLTAAAATVTFAIVGGSDDSAAAGAIHAHGTASVPVRPTDPKRNRPIKRAVLAARRDATPEAAAAARRNARTAARSAGLKLGVIVSISETAPPFYFGPSFYDAALGSFGPGRFCGFVRRPVVRRDPVTGARRVVRRVRERRCRPTSDYGVSLEIGYEAG